MRQPAGLHACVLGSSGDTQASRSSGTLRENRTIVVLSPLLG
jgi:hypothetical protein